MMADISMVNLLGMRVFVNLDIIVSDKLSLEQ